MSDSNTRHIPDVPLAIRYATNALTGAQALAPREVLRLMLTALAGEDAALAAYDAVANHPASVQMVVWRRTNGDTDAFLPTMPMPADTARLVARARCIAGEEAVALPVGVDLNALCAARESIPCGDHSASIRCPNCQGGRDHVDGRNNGGAQ